MGKQTQTNKENNKDPSKESGITVERAERGARIKEARQRTGLSQPDFANQLGMTKQTQIAYENGSRIPDADYLAELYYRFAVDLGPLITGAPRAKTAKLSAAAEEMLTKYETLPAKLRKIVDDVLLLSWLAHQQRLTDS